MIGRWKCFLRHPVYAKMFFPATSPQMMDHLWDFDSKSGNNIIQQVQYRNSDICFSGQRNIRNKWSKCRFRWESCDLIFLKYHSISFVFNKCLIFIFNYRNLPTSNIILAHTSSRSKISVTSILAKYFFPLTCK